jgi:hypothetical protein
MGYTVRFLCLQVLGAWAELLRQLLQPLQP